MEKALKITIEVLLALAVLGYLGINLTASLPRSIVAENLLLAAVYALILLGVHRGMPEALIALVLVASFNAGRVSRSIWDPLEGWGPLALQHVPLLTLLIALAVLPALLLVRAHLAR